MPGFPLAAIGAGLGQFAQQYQQQQAQRERTMLLQMQLAKFQQDMKDRADQQKLASSEWALAQGEMGGASPVGGMGDLSQMSNLPGGTPQPQMSGRDLGGGLRAGGAVSDPRNLSGYIRETAQKYGVDPNIALKVYGSEGLANPVGDKGTSFGAPQLHIGGGLGDEFQRETGLDPRDWQNNERAMIDWSLKNAGRTGWGPYHGAARVGVGPRQGIGGAPQMASAGPQTATDATEGSPAAQQMPPGGPQTAQAGPPTATDAPDPAVRQANQQLERIITPDMHRKMTQQGLVGVISRIPGLSDEQRGKLFMERWKQLAPQEQEFAREFMQRQTQAHQEEMQQRRFEQTESNIDRRLEATAKNQANKGYTLLTDPATGKSMWVKPGEPSLPVDAPEGATKLGTASQAPSKPETVNFVADGIAKYDLAPLSGWAMRSKFGQDVMAKVRQLNPEYDQTKYQAKVRGSVAFTSGRQGDAIRSFSVSIDHLAVMEEAANALASGDVRALNYAQNRIAQELGYQGPIDFNFTKSIVGAEVSKAVIGGVGALKDREELRDSFNAANSPEQLAGVAEQAKKLMAGQLGGYRRQAQSAGMSEQDFERALSPRAKQELEALAGGAPSTGAPVAAPGAPGQETQGVPASAAAKYTVGQIIPAGGKQYRVIRIDASKPDDPEIEEVK